MITQQLLKHRPVETGEAEGLQFPPQIFANFHFWGIEKNDEFKKKVKVKNSAKLQNPLKLFKVY